MNLRSLGVYLLRFQTHPRRGLPSPPQTSPLPATNRRRRRQRALETRLETRDGRHGRDADEAGAAGPADAAPGAAADGAPPPRTDRPREG